MFRSLIAGVAQSGSEPPPTINLGPVLLLLAVVAIAYVVVTHIKEILTFLLVAAVALMVFGVFYLDELFRNTSATTPSV